MEKVIAIDFDGVIAATDTAKVIFAHDFIGLSISEKHMKQRYFIEIYGKKEGIELYSKIIQGVYNSSLMLSLVNPVPNAKNSIHQLNKLGWRCVIVTSRTGNIYIKEDSPAKWAWRFLIHNGFSINQDDFINTADDSKLKVCIDVGAVALVDDDYLKLQPVINSGIIGFLYSTNTNLNDEVLYYPFLANRIKDWPDLINHLESFH